jgi:hypothetical protein
MLSNKMRQDILYTALVNAALKKKKAVFTAGASEHGEIPVN